MELSAGLHVFLALLDVRLDEVSLLDVLNVARLVNKLVQLLLEAGIAALSCLFQLLQLQVHFLLLAVVVFNVVRGQALGTHRQNVEIG